MFFYYFFFGENKTKFIGAGEEPIVEQINSDGQVEWAKHISRKPSELFSILQSISPKFNKVEDPSGGNK